MIPEIFEYVDKIKTTTNGKTDRNYYTLKRLVIERKVIAPKTKNELLICEGFKYALNIDEVSADDNFFIIGGSSLLVSKFLVYAKQNNLNISYSDVFTHQTPILLAENLLQSKILNYDYEMSEIDYSKINEILSQNTMDDYSQRPLKNVLLTGATGYLGAHILKELISDDTVDNVYCLVRSTSKISAEKRLKSKLFYYFNSMGNEANKIHVIEEDITSNTLEKSINVDIDHVINAAANVSHFVYNDALKKTNVDGVRNLLNFCKIKKATFIQISTISVAGFATEQKYFTENDLNIAQSIFNEYTYSKYQAEYFTLLARTEGVNVKIMRVGNLQGRISDGEFQMNLNENAFAGHLKAFYNVNMVSNDLKNSFVNISPVDETAKAIIYLSKSSHANIMFHVIASQHISYEALINQMNSVLDCNIKYVDNDKFDQILDEYSKDIKKYKLIESIIVEKKNVHIKDVLVTSDKTVAFLKNLGFNYIDIDEKYFVNYFNSLNELMFFDNF